MDGFLETVAKFVARNGIGNGLRLVAGFLVVRLMSPEEYGTFTSAGIYMGYLFVAQFGVIDGLSREFPFLLGKGKKELAHELSHSAFALTTVLGVLAFAIFLCYGIGQIHAGHLNKGLAFAGYSVIAGTHLLNKVFFPVLYTSNQRFAGLSRISIFQGLLNLLTIPLVYLHGFVGLIIRGLLLSFSESALLFYHRPFGLKLRFSLTQLKSLFAVGFPMYIVAIVPYLNTIAINTYLLAVGGEANFGLYGIGLVFFGVISLVPYNFNQALFPRVTSSLSHGRDLRTIARQNSKSVFIQFAVVALLCTTCSLAIPPFIDFFFPQYHDSIPSAQWLSFVPLAQSTGAFNCIFNAAKKQLPLVISLVFGSLVGLLYIKMRLTIMDKFELTFFPQGLLIGTLSQNLLGLIFLRKIILKSRH